MFEFYRRWWITAGVVCFVWLLFEINSANAFNQRNDGVQPRFLKPFRLPFTGPTCTGCPQHYCDDDSAVQHGYCCGCAGMFDNLPIYCPGSLSCPLDNRGLCRDYEYMMQCCC